MNIEVHNSNPFQSSEKQSQHSNEIVESNRQIAEVQASIAIAKRFPRDEATAMDRILKACSRVTLAEQATYVFPRGGSQVSGPSIKLAEAIAQNWGNVNFGVKEIGQQEGSSTVMAYAWDLETNTRSEKIFVVPHIRHTRDGDYALTDPRDIYEAVSNQGSRRLRNCILSIIPGDVIDSALTQIEYTLKKREGSIAEQVKNMVDAFKTFGVSEEDIKKRVGHKLEAITAQELVELRKIYNSLRDEQSLPEQWFRK